MSGRNFADWLLSWAHRVPHFDFHFRRLRHETPFDIDPNGEYAQVGGEGGDAKLMTRKATKGGNAQKEGSPATIYHFDPWGRRTHIFGLLARRKRREGRWMCNEGHISWGKNNGQMGEWDEGKNM